jgi:glycosyltransferase involved in cell wall biosynthesis
LSDVVTFRPKTAYSEVPLDYRKAHLFITTSVSDGTPVSILEAMASGLPCIATRVGGIPEWVEDGSTGILIRPRDPDAVAEAILKLAKNPALRDGMGSAARDVVVRSGQWASLMAQAEKDYQALTRT